MPLQLNPNENQTNTDPGMPTPQDQAAAAVVRNMQTVLPALFTGKDVSLSPFNLAASNASKPVAALNLGAGATGKAVISSANEEGGADGSDSEAGASEPVANKGTAGLNLAVGAPGAKPFTTKSGEDPAKDNAVFPGLNADNVDLAGALGHTGQKADSVNSKISAFRAISQSYLTTAAGQAAFVQAKNAGAIEASTASNYLNLFAGKGLVPDGSTLDKINQLGALEQAQQDTAVLPAGVYMPSGLRTRIRELRNELDNNTRSLQTEAARAQSAQAQSVLSAQAAAASDNEINVWATKAGPQAVLEARVTGKLPQSLLDADVTLPQFLHKTESIAQVYGAKNDPEALNTAYAQRLDVNSDADLTKLGQSLTAKGAIGAYTPIDPNKPAYNSDGTQMTPEQVALHNNEVADNLRITHGVAIPATNVLSSLAKRAELRDKAGITSVDLARSANSAAIQTQPLLRQADVADSAHGDLTGEVGRITPTALTASNAVKAAALATKPNDIIKSDKMLADALAGINDAKRAQVESASSDKVIQAAYSKYIESNGNIASPQDGAALLSIAAEHGTDTFPQIKVQTAMPTQVIGPDGQPQTVMQPTEIGLVNPLEKLYAPLKEQLTSDKGKFSALDNPSKLTAATAATAKGKKPRQLDNYALTSSDANTSFNESDPATIQKAKDAFGAAIKTNSINLALNSALTENPNDFALYNQLFTSDPATGNMKPTKLIESGDNPGNVDLVKVIKALTEVNRPDLIGNIAQQFTNQGRINDLIDQQIGSRTQDKALGSFIFGSNKALLIDQNGGSKIANATARLAARSVIANQLRAQFTQAGQDYTAGVKAKEERKQAVNAATGADILSGRFD